MHDVAVKREQDADPLSRAALVAAPATPRLSPAGVLALQRSAGNAAVGRALSAVRTRALQYMGVDKDRDHYRSELLDRMCKVSFQF